MLDPIMRYFRNMLLSTSKASSFRLVLDDELFKITDLNEIKDILFIENNLKVSLYPQENGTVLEIERLK